MLALVKIDNFYFGSSEYRSFFRKSLSFNIYNDSDSNNK